MGTNAVAEFVSIGLIRGRKWSATAAPARFSTYLVYVDESGDHKLTQERSIGDACQHSRPVRGFAM